MVANTFLASPDGAKTVMACATLIAQLVSRELVLSAGREPRLRHVVLGKSSTPGLMEEISNALPELIKLSLVYAPDIRPYIIPLTA